MPAKFIEQLKELQKERHIFDELIQELKKIEELTIDLSTGYTMQLTSQQDKSEILDKFNELLNNYKLFYG